MFSFSCLAEHIAIEESPGTFPPMNYTREHTTTIKTSLEPTPPTTKANKSSNKTSSTNKKRATKTNKKLKKAKQRSSSFPFTKDLKNRPGVTTVVVDGSRNASVNMCPHCSRAFCGRKALYVHTLKMHGKEYLKKRTPQAKTSPFTCWFCSANFTCPENVVEHMTNAHENLDKLSKRIESQNLPAGTTALPTKIADPTPKFIPIAPHKQVLPVASLRTGSTAAAVSATSLQTASSSTTNLDSPNSNHHHQPPPGFKMSYALAYVPVFVPDRLEEDETNTDDEQTISIKKS